MLDYPGNKQKVEHVESDGKHQIIEIDGKRYLVIQELPPQAQYLDDNEEVEDEED